MRNSNKNIATIIVPVAQQQKKPVDYSKFFHLYFFWNSHLDHIYFHIGGHLYKSSTYSYTISMKNKLIVF